MHKARVTAFLPLLLLTACPDYGPSQVAPPDAISVEAAFKDVANGLMKFRSIVDPVDAQGHYIPNLGLITCRVYVHFIISAKADQKNSATATLAVPIHAVKVSGSDTYEAGASGERGNVVIVDIASENPQICAYYEKQSDILGNGTQQADNKGSTTTQNEPANDNRSHGQSGGNGRGNGGGHNNLPAQHGTGPTPPPHTPGHSTDTVPFKYPFPL